MATAESEHATCWIDEVFGRFLGRLTQPDGVSDEEMAEAIANTILTHNLAWDLKPSLPLAMLRMLFIEMAETPGGEELFCGTETGRMILATAAGYALGWKEGSADSTHPLPPLVEDREGAADLLHPLQEDTTTQTTASTPETPKKPANPREILARYAV